MKFYLLHEYDHDKINCRYVVTNVDVPEKRYDCENYRQALKAKIATSGWFPANGWQMQLPEEAKADRDMTAVAEAANAYDALDSTYEAA